MMAEYRTDLEFPFLKDDSQFIQQEDVLYKVKVRYDEETFKGKQISFTNNELNHELGQTFRAVFYMVENRIKFKPIVTDFFLIIPDVRRWMFPIKYPQYKFTRDNIPLQVSDILIELQIKHKDVLCENNEQKEPKIKTRSNRVHSYVNEESMQRTIAVHSLQSRDNPQRSSEGLSIESKQSRNGENCKPSNDNNQGTTRGSKFARDKTGQLRRYTVTSVDEDRSQNEIQNIDVSENNHINRTRETNKRKRNVAMDNSISKPKKSLPSSPVRNNQRGKHVEKNPRKAEDDHKVNRNTIITNKQKSSVTGTKMPSACVDCIEEHQFRRRSSRLKTGDGAGEMKQQYSNGVQNRNNSNNGSLQSQTASNGDGVIIASTGTSAEIVADQNEDFKVKRKKDPREPVLIYKDILQGRNKDRYTLEQLERDETNKLGELYDTSAPRRSARKAAQTEGRLSGMWNKLWDTFFTPHK